MSELGVCDIPVHCIIEALPDNCCMKCTIGGESTTTTTSSRKLLDSYAIVAGRTPLSKLNDAVLTAMGFSQFASNASISSSATLPLKNESNKVKGLIVIDNWKPLTFDQITDDIETPIEHLFKHIGGNRWTLKILVSANVAKDSNGQSGDKESVTGASPDGSAKGTFNDQESIAHPDTSHLNWLHLLPRYHPYLQNYGTYASKMDSVTTNIAAFMANRLLIPNQEAANGGRAPSVQLSPSSTTTSTWPESADEKGRQRQNSTNESVGKTRTSPKYESTQQRRSVLVSPRSSVGHGGGGSGLRHAAPTQCRLMFDPLTELPLLNEWFENNSHPTCHDIEKFTELLNVKPYRRTYPPVSTHNVKIWFKNRRAKCKRV